jgi:tetratricopeptide (TPR) repeat protein
MRLSFLALAEGQAEASAEYRQRGLALAEQFDNPGLLTWASRTVALLELVEGRPQAARARLEPFLDSSFLSVGAQAPRVLHLLGWASLELGDLQRAEALLAEASTLESSHLRLAVVGVLHSQARLALRQSRWQEAEQVLAEALALTQATHTPYEEAQTLYLSGQLHQAKGEPIQAREQLEAALAILHRLGERLYAERVEQALLGLGHQAGDERT